MQALRRIFANPLSATAFIIGVSTVVGGVYLLSPLLVISTVINGASPLVNVLGTGLGIWAFGLYFLASGIFLLLGLARNNVKFVRGGLLASILGRFYSILAYFIIIGPLPLTWLANLTVACISIVVWLALRDKNAAY